MAKGSNRRGGFEVERELDEHGLPPVSRMHIPVPPQPPLPRWDVDGRDWSSCAIRVGSDLTFRPSPGKRPDPGVVLGVIRLLDLDEAMGGELLGTGRDGAGVVSLVTGKIGGPGEDEMRMLVAAWALLCREGFPPVEIRQLVNDSRGTAMGAWRWVVHAEQNPARTEELERILIRPAAERGLSMLMLLESRQAERGVLARAAEVSADLQPVMVEQVARVARVITRDSTTTVEALAALWPADRDPATVDGFRLRLSVRQGVQETAEDYLLRVAQLAEPVPAQPPQGRLLDDLPGMGEAGEWGREVVEDLADYRAGRLAWHALDHGVLLEGPPGVGKTTFAAALAASAGVPLVRGSYGEWEGVGVLGGSRDTLRNMRQTFAEAREAAERAGACILLLDELDSFPVRGTGAHNESYWRPVTNALLELLDGGAERPGVLVVACTNNAAVIDPAMRRPGRLDRHITIPLPSPHDLEDILVTVISRLGAEPPVGLAGAASMAAAAGATGADAENWVKRALRMARKARRTVTARDIEDAISGSEEGAVDGLDGVVRIHEAGHAIAAELLWPGSVTGVSVRAIGGRAGGVLIRRPAAVGGGERSSLVQALAGRAAEEAALHGVTSGSGGDHGSDLHYATLVATAAETSWGLGDHPERLLYRGEASDHVRTMALLDADEDLRARVSLRLEAAYDAALAMMVENLHRVRFLADALAHRPVLTGDDVRRLIGDADRALEEQLERDAEDARQLAVGAAQALRSAQGHPMSS